MTLRGKPNKNKNTNKDTERGHATHKTHNMQACIGPTCHALPALRPAQTIEAGLAGGAVRVVATRTVA